MSTEKSVFSLDAIRFAGVQRCGDDKGHNAFEVFLPSQPSLYGEWIKKYADNESDFSVQIISFGYLTADNLSNKAAGARKKLTENEVEDVRDLVIKLFSDVGSTPFASKKSRYTGNIYFSPGWVLT